MEGAPCVFQLKENDTASICFFDLSILPEEEATFGGIKKAMACEKSPPLTGSERWLDGGERKGRTEFMAQTLFLKSADSPSSVMDVNTQQQIRSQNYRHIPGDFLKMKTGERREIWGKTKERQTGCGRTEVKSRSEQQFKNEQIQAALNKREAGFPHPAMRSERMNGGLTACRQSDSILLWSYFYY